MVFVTKYSKFCLINKKDGELDEDLYKRAWFIVSQLSSNNLDNIELIKLSKLWKNNKHYRCKYNQQLMDKISKFENNMYSVSSNFKH
jgi:hypothetical protein